MTTPYNTLQVFTSASIGYGFHTADTLAEHIKTNTDSPYFPLTNLGPQTDTLAHEAAAIKHGLTPLYGRSLSVFEKNDPLILIAKTNEGRERLYEMPPNFSSPSELLESLTFLGKQHVLTFVPHTWLNDEHLSLWAARFKSAMAAYLAFDLRDLIERNDLNQLAEWSVVPHFPLQTLSQADLFRSWDVWDGLKAGRHTPDYYFSRYTSPAEMTHINTPDLLECSLVLLEDMTVSLVELFEQCQTSPIANTFSHKHEPKAHEKLVTRCLLQLERWIETPFMRRTYTPDPLRYRKRLMQELELIETRQLTNIFEQTLELHAWSKDHLALLRGQFGRSLLLHLFGMTLVDPVNENLPFSMLLTHFDDERTPRFDFDTCEKAREHIDYNMRRLHVENYVEAIHVHKTSVCQALRNLSKLDKTTPADAREFREIADNIDFLDHPLSVSDICAHNPAVDKAFARHPDAKQFVGNVFGLGNSLHRRCAFRAVLPLGQPRIAPVTSRPLHSHDNQDEHYVIGATTQELERVPSYQCNLLGLNVLSWMDEVFRDPRSRLTGLQDIPLDDPAIYDSLQTSRLGVFHLDSDAFDSAIKQTQPRSITDLAILLVLIRPGTLENGSQQAYLNDTSLLPKALDCPEARDILSSTKGVLLFQEQVHQLLSQIGGLSDTEAAAWSRKTLQLVNKEDVADRLFDCLKAQGCTRRVANALVDFLSDFGPATFSKAHALAYATLSYYSLWLRQHRPNLYLLPLLNERLKRTASRGERASVLSQMLALHLQIQGVEKEHLDGLQFEVRDDVWYPKPSNKKLSFTRLSRWGYRV